MHKEVLSEKQEQLLPLLKIFSDNFGLAGGTAIALQLGHRRSIDFDLFSLKDIDNEKIREEIRKVHEVESVLVDQPNELSLIVNGVKLSYVKYPFEISFSEMLDDVIKMPNLITLASMKAYALGRRAKWKDYVDLYFIFEKLSFREVTEKTKELFKGEFNEKLLREQLCYFEDIDYTERIDYLEGIGKSDKEVQERLTEIGLTKE